MGKKNIAREGDLCIGHDSCPDTVVTTYSDNVKVEGKWCARIDDQCDSHGCPAHTIHVRHIAVGAAKVLVNNRKMAYKDAAIDCGGRIGAGASKSYVGP